MDNAAKTRILELMHSEDGIKVLDAMDTDLRNVLLKYITEAATKIAIAPEKAASMELSERLLAQLILATGSLFYSVIAVAAPCFPENELKLMLHVAQDHAENNYERSKETFTAIDPSKLN